MMEKIKTHKELRVYQLSFEAGMEIFNLTKSFPKEERYSLTDQVRRSSRSVSGNLAEAWRKRRYPKSFVAKLSDSEGEAAETQVWLDYAFACGYIDKVAHEKLYDKYDHPPRKMEIIMKEFALILRPLAKSPRRQVGSFTSSQNLNP